VSTTYREDAHVHSRTHRDGAYRHWGVAVTVLNLAGIGLVLLSTTKYGAGLCPDSVRYLDFARSLALGKGLVSHTGTPLVWWPPLYPMLLAFLSLATRLDPAAFVHFVNAILFAFALCLSARMFRANFPQSAGYGVLGVCTVLFCPTMSRVYTMAWSECLFIPLVLLYLLSAQRCWHNGGMRSVAFMALSTALACLTRYVGVALIPAGVATIILATRVNFRTRLTRAFAFAALSLAPLGLWLVHIYRLTGTPFGHRGPSGYSFAGSVILCVKTLLWWYLPANGAKYIALAGITVALVVIISLRAVRTRVLSGIAATFRNHPPALLFLAAFPAVVVIAATRGVDVDSRMLSPIYIPATLILLELAVRLLSPLQLSTNAFVRKTPVMLLTLWLCLPLQSVARSTAGRLKDGAGNYNTKDWRESEIIVNVRRVLLNIDGVQVYSNDPFVLWELAGVNATWAPHRTYYNSTKSANKLGDLIGRWPSGREAYLVWFTNVKHKYLFSVNELREISDVVEVAHFRDGSVYRVSVRDAAGQDSGRPANGAPGEGGNSEGREGCFPAF
jgi:hypothetical protein